MSTEMDGATPVVADEPQPSAGRERVLDAVGLRGPPVPRRGADLRGR